MNIFVCNIVEGKFRQFQVMRCDGKLGVEDHSKISNSVFRFRAKHLLEQERAKEKYALVKTESLLVDLQLEN